MKALFLFAVSFSFLRKVFSRLSIAPTPQHHTFAHQISAPKCFDGLLKASILIWIKNTFQNFFKKYIAVYCFNG